MNLAHFAALPSDAHTLLLAANKRGDVRLGPHRYRRVQKLSARSLRSPAGTPPNSKTKHDVFERSEVLV